MIKLQPLGPMHGCEMYNEATSALDPELVGEVLEVMKQLARDGTTMVAVTHEMNFALEVADHVVLMEAGKILEQGPARDVLLHSRNPRAASFLSRFHEATHRGRQQADAAKP